MSLLSPAVRIQPSRHAPVRRVSCHAQRQFWPELAAAPSQAGGKPLPLAIMTSGDTDQKTRLLLERNGYFGMKKEQVTVVKQEKVVPYPCRPAKLAL